MADTFIVTRKGAQPVAIVSVHQLRHYGSYDRALKALKSDFLMTPEAVEDWGDLDPYLEVGHA